MQAEPTRDYRTIVVPYDFSAHADAALRTATDLARRLGSDLHLVHVVQPPTYSYAYGTGVGVAPVAPAVDMGEVRAGATSSLRDVASKLEGFDGKVESQVVEGTSVPFALCETSEALGSDLIVMGTHGRTGLAHVFLGSVAERTLRSAPCPVLTVQAREEDEDGD